MLISIAFAMTAQAQTEQRLSIDEMFRMIDQRNSSIKADRTAVEAAGEGVKAARGEEVIYAGNKRLMARAGVAAEDIN